MRDQPDGSFLVRDSQSQAQRDVQEAVGAVRGAAGTCVIRDREYTLTLRFSLFSPFLPILLTPSSYLLTTFLFPFFHLSLPYLHVFHISLLYH